MNVIGGPKWPNLAEGVGIVELYSCLVVAALRSFLAVTLFLGNLAVLLFGCFCWSVVACWSVVVPLGYDFADTWNLVLSCGRGLFIKIMRCTFMCARMGLRCFSAPEGMG